MKKPAVFLAGVGSCALAVASCSSGAASPTSTAQSDAGADSAQSAPGATASPTIDPDTALTSKNGQGGPSAQSGQDSDSSVVVIVQLEESADGEATLASINEAVAAAFPGESVEVEREYVNALQGWSLRAPAGALEAIRGANGVESAYLDGEMRVQ